ncbi:DUF2177 family protein [Variovorax sp. RA8]|uniref:DUF2177 family protein n=1 Tax=Variovorax sp. (strain JCM 16519 / RA8) TaxID=662548 RepID=UPI0013162AAA|nr:DUF2177 family protein [Variovorax sp. RA8]VTU15791.1 putative membrane protein [Variovorax sp. RA8]
MSIRQFLIAYATSALVFLAIDATWLATMAGRLYRPAIGHLMRPDVDVKAAVIFYTLYVAGIVIFAVAPALESRSWTSALGRGALLGLFAYATYDLTNQATLRDWPWRLTLVDLAWGAVVTAAAAAAGCRLVLAFGGPAR